MKIKCKRRIQAQTQSSQSYINAAQNGNDLVNQLEIAQKAEDKEYIQKQEKITHKHKLLRKITL